MASLIGDTGRKIHLAGYYTARKSVFDTAYPNFLESYHYLKQQHVDLIRGDGRKVFLDSGAFSMFTKGVKIPLSTYAGFIKENQDIIKVASVLDGIGDPVLTANNQKELEDLGVEVVPCFHYGEPESFLEDYLAAGYPYISLGGMVPISTPQLFLWLDRIWDRYLTDKGGWPIVKVHGFGLTVLSLMLRYPWYSVDSTSWVMTGAFGSIFFPAPHHPERKICISEKSPNLKSQDQHYHTLPAPMQGRVRQELEAGGYTIEELQRDYWKRDQWNINVLRSLTDQPLEPFILRQPGLFE